MLRALVAIVLSLAAMPALAQGPPPVYCNTGFAQAAQTGPLAITRIVTGAAGQAIYLCGWNINNTGGAAVTVTLSSGTGTNCGTGTVTMVTLTVTNGQTNIEHGPSMVQLPPANDLCWTLTGTGTFNGTIYYGLYGAR